MLDTRQCIIAGVKLSSSMDAIGEICGPKTEGGATFVTVQCGECFSTSVLGRGTAGEQFRCSVGYAQITRSNGGIVIDIHPIGFGEGFVPKDLPEEKG